MGLHFRNNRRREEQLNQERWRQERDVPTWGGIPICIITTAIFLFEEYYLLGVGFLVLGIAGLWDDRKGISVESKLIAQIVAVSCLMVQCGLSITWMNCFIFFCAIALINAMNMIDNMDGLCAGVALITCLFFGEWWFAVLLAAFLFFNFPNAKVFLGDCGSMTIGLFLAWCCFRETGIEWMRCGLILIVPIADVVFVTVTRIARGQRPWIGDTTHLSHRLARKVGDTGAVVILGWCCIVGGLLSTLI